MHIHHIIPHHSTLHSIFQIENVCISLFFFYFSAGVFLIFLLVSLFIWLDLCVFVWRCVHLCNGKTASYGVLIFNALNGTIKDHHSFITLSSWMNVWLMIMLMIMMMMMLVVFVCICLTYTSFTIYGGQWRIETKTNLPFE